MVRSTRRCVPSLWYGVKQRMRTHSMKLQEKACFKFLGSLRASHRYWLHCQKPKLAFDTQSIEIVGGSPTGGPPIAFLLACRNTFLWKKWNGSPHSNWVTRGILQWTATAACSAQGGFLFCERLKSGLNKPAHHWALAVPHVPTQ